MTLPREITERIPMMQEAWLPNYYRLREHPDAPRWNTRCGDRLMAEDMPFIRAFRESLYHRRVKGSAVPSEDFIHYARKVQKHSAIIRRRTQGLSMDKDFHAIPPMSREDLAVRLHEVVPEDIALDRLVLYDTSGTTGHAIRVPNHPRAIGCYDPMVTFCLERHGVKPVFDHTMTACFLICAQENTITYCTVHSQLNGAGYAKINMKPSEWPRENSPAKFISDLNPLFLTGDPIAFSELMKSDLQNYKPRALLSTAMALTNGFRRVLADHFNCPVIDFYSLNDTGPIAYSCPLNPDAYHILPPDLFVEITGDEGQPLQEGEWGEITVTGGRNPFVPLLRYRTGDYARIRFEPCDCGDPMPRLYDLEGRRPVLFKKTNGQTVNPIDISKIIRRFPVVQHQFIQANDLSCILKIRPDHEGLRLYESEIRNHLTRLFGGELSLTIEFSGLAENGSARKAIPYLSPFKL